MRREKYGVYSAFDIEKHRETFVNYLEVIILPSGKVEYAVPSHLEKLAALGMAKHGDKSKASYYARIPKDVCADYFDWILQDTGCVAIWTDVVRGVPNRFQRHAIERLRREGLLKTACRIDGVTVQC